MSVETEVSIDIEQFAPGSVEEANYGEPPLMEHPPEEMAGQDIEIRTKERKKFGVSRKFSAGKEAVGQEKEKC